MDVLEADGSAAPLVVVLAGIQDPATWARFRSAEAFGATRRCEPARHREPLEPESGARLGGQRLPPASIAGDCRTNALRACARPACRFSPPRVRAEPPADAVDLTGPVALLIGNEGNGVPDEIAAQADGAVTIPCPGPVESLNAAVAASVLLYEASRQRRVSRRPQHREEPA